MKCVEDTSAETHQVSESTPPTLSPERHAYFRRLEKALARQREVISRGEETLLDDRVVGQALQNELGRVWDEAVADHKLRADGKYTIADVGRIIEFLPEETAG